jgi:hypothetical protein
MKILKSFFLFNLICFVMHSNINGQEEIDNQSKISQLKGAYIGQNPPGLIPELFLPGTVSTKEWNEPLISISPEGNIIYWSRWKKINGNNQSENVSIKRMVNKWSDIIQIEDIPFILANGKGYINKSTREKVEIWTFDFSDGRFENLTKILLPYEGMMMYLTASEKGNLYFTAINGENKTDIYISELNDTKYQTPVPLESPVNTEYHDEHGFIAPDESYIVFDSRRPGGFGGGDLYICFRLDDGTWGKAINLGDKINTSNWEIVPYVSPDQKFLFYGGSGDKYWVDFQALVKKLKN